jgi:hypothetical protein
LQIAPDGFPITWNASGINLFRCTINGSPLLVSREVPLHAGVWSAQAGCIGSLVADDASSDHQDVELFKGHTFQRVGAGRRAEVAR